MFLMICSVIYEYGTVLNIEESDFSNPSNNNNKNCSYIENLPQDHKISINDDCNKQIFKKISNDMENDIHSQPIEKEGNITLFFMLCFTENF